MVNDGFYLKRARKGRELGLGLGLGLGDQDQDQG